MVEVRIRIVNTVAMLLADVPSGHEDSRDRRRIVMDLAPFCTTHDDAHDDEAHEGATQPSLLPEQRERLLQACDKVRRAAGSMHDQGALPLDGGSPSAPDLTETDPSAASHERRA